MACNHHTPAIDGGARAAYLSPAKVVFEGTHRVRTPQQTWEWIKPKLRLAGITRVADITWLDEIGVPVFQAIRPNSMNLSVSQGKGINADLARVSAAMEAIELWHGEQPPRAPCRISTVREMERIAGYRVRDLALAHRHYLNASTRLQWRQVSRVDGQGDSFVPAELIRLDFRFDTRWSPSLFTPTSVGLASGNILAEALLHGMYEVVERDAIARATPHQLHPVDVETIEDARLSALADRFRAAKVQVSARFVGNRFRIPTFDVRIRSDALPVVCRGAGTHLDARVALSRALTEAAQSRATLIAGARDDIGKSAYREARAAGTGHSSGPFAAPEQGTATIAFRDVDSSCLHDIDLEVACVAGRIQEVTGHAPLYADLTRADAGVPVVHVVVPGARHLRPLRKTPGR
jgi:ribosomal protein S12 methylthiotransferase accessory factor